jgi:hypothetical protein
MSFEEWKLIKLNYNDNDNKNYWHYGGYFIKCTQCKKYYNRIEQCFMSKVCIHCGNFCNRCLSKYKYNYAWHQQMIKKETRQLIVRDDLLFGGFNNFTMVRIGDNSCPECRISIIAYLKSLMGIFIKDLHNLITSYIDINEISIIIDNLRRDEQECKCIKCNKIFDKNKYIYDSKSLCNVCDNNIKSALQYIICS